jgi:hypothetical protein
MKLIDLFYTKQEPFRFFTFIILGYASFILLNTGNGLNGIHLLILFIISITPVFLTKLFFHNKVKKIDFHFNIATLALLVGLITWVSLVDYFFVEIFKITTANLLENSNVYWLLLFSGITAFFIYSIVVFYFVITRNLQNTIRFLLVSVFILNSALNDFLYYILFNIPLPNEWSWIYQPRFIFGEIITTPQLMFWSLGVFLATVIIYLTPFELLTPNQMENETTDHSKKWVDYIIVIGFFIIGVYHVIFFVPKVKGVIRDLNTEINLKIDTTNQILKDKVSTNELSADQYKKLSSEIYTSKLKVLEDIQKYLTIEYTKNGTYPVSSGNCTQKWDSSNIALPFNNFTPKDPLDKGSACDFKDDSNPILYYSDGTSYAILMSAQGIENINSYISATNNYLYIPKKRDVLWFQNEQTRFWRDWQWSSQMIVYMVISEKEVTTFIDL